MRRNNDGIFDYSSNNFIFTSKFKTFGLNKKGTLINKMGVFSSFY